MFRLGKALASSLSKHTVQSMAASFPTTVTGVDVKRVAAEVLESQSVRENRPSGTTCNAPNPKFRPSMLYCLYFANFLDNPGSLYDLVLTWRKNRSISICGEEVKAVISSKATLSDESTQTLQQVQFWGSWFATYSVMT